MTTLLRNTVATAVLLFCGCAFFETEKQPDQIYYRDIETTLEEEGKKYKVSADVIIYAKGENMELVFGKIEYKNYHPVCKDKFIAAIKEQLSKPSFDEFLSGKVKEKLGLEIKKALNVIMKKNNVKGSVTEVFVTDIQIK